MVAQAVRQAGVNEAIARIPHKEHGQHSFDCRINNGATVGTDVPGGLTGNPARQTGALLKRCSANASEHQQLSRRASHLFEARLAHDRIKAEQPDNVAAFGCLATEHSLTRLALARLPIVRRKVAHHGFPVTRVQARA
jgi:hypothetical protein